MEEKISQLITMVNERRNNLIEILSYKDRIEEGINKLNIILKEDEELRLLYDNNKDLFSQAGLKQKYKEYVETTEIIKVNYKKYCDIVEKEPFATKQYLEYFTDLLRKLLETADYIKELHKIENDFSYKGKLIQVTDVFGNKRFINPDKALRYYGLILKIRESYNKIEPLYKSLFYKEANKNIKYPGSIKDDSIYFSATNEINPYAILDQYENNLMDLMSFSYIDTEMKYNNMLFKVSKANEKKILFNLKQITDIVSEYGIDISPTLKNFLKRRNISDSEITFTKTYIIEPELNIDIPISLTTDSDILSKSETLDEYINNIKEIFNKSGKKRIVKYKGNSFMVPSAYSGKFLDNLMKINRTVINEKLYIDTDFIDFLASKAINKKAIIIFGEKQTIKHDIPKDEVKEGKNQDNQDNIIKIENVRKAKYPKKLKRALKVASLFITSAVILMSQTLKDKKDLDLSNYLEAQNDYQVNMKMSEIPNDVQIFDVIDDVPVFSFDDVINVKENSKIYENIYDAQSEKNGKTPYFDGNDERTIEAVGIIYNNDLIYISQNDENASQKVDYYLMNGGEIQGVLCRNVNDHNNYEGFYNYKDIIPNITAKRG